MQSSINETNHLGEENLGYLRILDIIMNQSKIKIASFIAREKITPLYFASLHASQCKFPLLESSNKEGNVNLMIKREERPYLLWRNHIMSKV